MSVKIYYENDANLDVLKDKTIAVIGYGNQGRSQALNLRDSGLRVLVGHDPERASFARAQGEGFQVLAIAEAVKKADLLAMLLPDEVLVDVYNREVAPHLDARHTLLFSHGFNVHFNKIAIPGPVDAILLAPKAPGNAVRSEYERGFGVPCLFATLRDESSLSSKQYALAYAKALGCTRAGVLATSFREETETDLFGEQAVLCGGLCELVKSGFDTLVAAGYSQEMAYFECCHELKLITDLIHKGGLTFMRKGISNTAEYGDYHSGAKVIGPEVRRNMQRVLDDIRSGSFADKWHAESKEGFANFNNMRAHHSEHPMEAVGEFLRSHMQATGE